jgi:hypothetical protein
VKSIVAAMKHPGGGEVDPLAAARILWLETHPLPSEETTAEHNEADR